MSYARIIGTGSYMPDEVITNHDLERIIDTSDAWIRERTGIAERRRVAPDQTCGDLAEQAALRALEAAGVPASSIDLIIVGTCTPDRVFPSTAFLLQQRLGMRHGSLAFDLSAACSGFVYGLGVANQFFRTGSVKRALVIGAETMTRILDWTDRSTCVLFGDGAGATVLEASDEPGILSAHLHSDGQYSDLLGVPWGPGQGYEKREQVGPYITMQGNEVFKVAVRTLSRIVDESLAANGLKKSDIDWLVPHQANIRIIQATARKLEMPMERVVVTVDKQGNTSAASIPMALDTAIRDGRIKPGELLLLEAFGGGFTWGSALIRY